MLFITINNDSPTPSPDRPYKIYKNGSYSPSRFTLSEGEKVLGLIPVASVIPCGNSISIPGWREADFVPLASVTQGWLNGHPLLSKAGKRIYTLVDNGSQRRIWGWVPSQAAMTPGYGITSIKIVNRRRIKYNNTPFHTDFAIDPAWLAWEGGMASKLVQEIYRTHKFEDLPILADALEEAGCENVDLLQGLRTIAPIGILAFVRLLNSRPLPDGFVLADWRERETTPLWDKYGWKITDTCELFVALRDHYGWSVQDTANFFIAPFPSRENSKVIRGYLMLRQLLPIEVWEVIHRHPVSFASTIRMLVRHRGRNLPLD